VPDQSGHGNGGPTRRGDAGADHHAEPDTGTDAGKRTGGGPDDRALPSPGRDPRHRHAEPSRPPGEPEPIGRAIRRARRRLGLTLEQLAARCGCAKSYLSAIETGRRGAPSEALLGRLESALFIPPGELVRLAAWARVPEAVRREVARSRPQGRLPADQDAALRRLREIMGPHPEPQGGQRTGQDPEQDPGSDAAGAATPASPLDEAYRSGELRRLIDAIDPDEAPAGPTSPDGMPTVDLPFEVPLINKVAAGYPAGFTDLGYPARVADDYVRCPDLRDPDAFAARVVGDSMAPDYREGDIVVFSPAREIADGDDCFARLTPEAGDDESTFKRVYFERDGERERIRLQPINSRFRPRVLDREEVAGLYRAVQVMRSV